MQDRFRGGCGLGLAMGRLCLFERKDTANPHKWVSAWRSDNIELNSCPNSAIL